MILSKSLQQNLCASLERESGLDGPAHSTCGTFGLALQPPLQTSLYFPAAHRSVCLSLSLLHTHTHTVMLRTPMFSQLRAANSRPQIPTELHMQRYLLTHLEPCASYDMSNSQNKKLLVTDLEWELFRVEDPGRALVCIQVVHFFHSARL